MTPPHNRDVPPPHDLMAEEALIGAVLINQDILPELDIKSDDFYIHRYRFIWDAILSLQEKQHGIDVVTVASELESRGLLSEVRGQAELTRLTNECATSMNAPAHADKVREYANKRKLQLLGQRMHNEAQNGRTAASIASDAEKDLSKIVIHSGKKHSYNAQTAVQMSVDATERASKGEKPIMSNIPPLDDILGGFHKTDLIVVACRPGQGKSAFLLSVMNQALEQDKKVLLFSVEMNVEQVTHRLLAQNSGISATALRDGKIQDDQWTEYFSAVENLSAKDFIVNDTPAIQIGQIRTASRQEKPDLILIDYIQLVNPDTKQERRDLDIGEAVRGAKALAKELDVPVLIAAQIGRGAEQRADKRPTMADLRESGAIENDADVIVFIHYPDEYEPAKESRSADLIVAKHRNGPVGTARAVFKFKITSFEADTQPRYKDYTV